MLEDRKIQILQEIFGDYYKQGNEFLFQCIKCKHHKKKLSFNIEKDYFKCWICEWSSKSIYWAVKQYGTSQQIQEWNSLTGHIDFSTLSDKKDVVIPKVELPKEFISLATHKITPSSKVALDYLKGRGLTFKDIVWWKMGFCIEGKYKGRIIIPSFDMSGHINYFVARSYEDSYLSYLNPPIPKNIIFNELFIDWDKDLSIVEGVFDVIVSGNSIPLLGSTLDEASPIFQTITKRCRKIYSGLDPDAEKKEIEIMNRFLMYGVDVYKIPIKPWADIGQMSKEEFIKRKNNSIHITKENDIEYLLKQ